MSQAAAKAFSAEEIAKVNVENIRNIGVSAHIDSGKTTVTERILYYSGRIDAIHDVKGKDGVGAKMDSMELERQRGITIKSAATSMFWKGNQINLIDTPGHIDFTVEVERALRVLDGAVLVLCASGGVQTQTHTVYRQIMRYGVPFISFINKLDRLGGDAYRTLDQMRNNLGVNAAMLYLPIGIEKDFEGLIDVLGERTIHFDGDSGENLVYGSLPTSVEGQLISKRDDLIECLSNVDEDIGERYLMEEDISNSDIKKAIKRTVLSQQFTPVVCGSALKNKGIQPLLDTVNEYLPNPTEVLNYGINISSEDKVLMSPTRSKQALPVALAFKLEQNQFGQLTYIRVYQGCIKRGNTIINTRTGQKMRVPRLVLMHSSEYEEINEAYAGDIVAMIGVECASGDTFVDAGMAEDKMVSMENIFVPEPVISLRISNKHSKDDEKFAKALNRFQKEDPTFKCSFNAERREMILHGMGELHLDIYAERIRREYHCEVDLGMPTVNYRETVTAEVPFEVTYKRQSGGRGQYANIVGKITPLDKKDAELEFVDRVTHGAIPHNFIKSVEKGVRQALNEGALTGNKITGIRFELTTGKTHQIDSSDFAFSKAGYFAIKEEFVKKAVSLEPYMTVTITAPEQYSGSIMQSLTTRRAMTSGIDIKNGYCTVFNVAPLKDMFGYTTELRSITKGTGEYAMEFKEYLPLEPDDEQELVGIYQETPAYKNRERSDFGV